MNYKLTQPTKDYYTMLLIIISRDGNNLLSFKNFNIICTSSCLIPDRILQINVKIEYFYHTKIIYIDHTEYTIFTCYSELENLNNTFFDHGKRKKDPFQASSLILDRIQQINVKIEYFYHRKKIIIQIIKSIQSLHAIVNLKI